MAVCHALTFDIEEWFHLVGVRAMDDRGRWESLEPTVERLTDQILELLSEYSVRGTFFTLGWVAERYPAMVQRIAECGHEVASHSYWHYEVYKHTPATFRDDLSRSIDALEQAGAGRIKGFRAPSFSLTPGCEWALDIMLDLGLEYDASIFPARRAHGGYPFRRGAGVSRMAPTGRPIRLLPMSVYTAGPLRLPFSGGGYLRLLPWSVLDRAMKQHEKDERPAVVYLHPWDFAVGGPTLPMPAISRFKCYNNRRSTEPKLRRLLSSYRFDTCAAVLGIDDAG